MQHFLRNTTPPYSLQYLMFFMLNSNLSEASNVPKYSFVPFGILEAVSHFIAFPSRSQGNGFIKAGLRQRPLAAAV